MDRSSCLPKNKKAKSKRKKLTTFLPNRLGAALTKGHAVLCDESSVVIAMASLDGSRPASLVDSALNLAVSTARRVQQVRAALAKLKLVEEELEKQYKVALSLSETVRGQCGEIIALSRDVSKESEAVAPGNGSDELSRVFQSLRERKVHRKLVAEGPSGTQGEAKTTLFDFIDANTVRKLQKQVNSEASVLRDAAMRAEQARGRVELAMESLREFRTSLRSFNGGVVDPGQLTERVKEQETVVKRMQSLMSQSDKIDDGATMRPTTSTGTSSTGAISHDGEMTRLHADMVAAAESVRPVVVSYGACYERAMSFFDALERTVPRLQGEVLELTSIRAQSHTRAVAVRQGLLELRNLAAWYRQFEKAYHAAEVEVARRHAYRNQRQAQIEKFQAEMDAAASKEVKQRSDFYSMHGRYLPPTLCPALQEPVTRCVVFPPSLTTDLPVLSSDNTVVSQPKQQDTVVGAGDARVGSSRGGADTSEAQSAAEAGVVAASVDAGE